MPFKRRVSLQKNDLIVRNINQLSSDMKGQSYLYPDIR